MARPKQPINIYRIAKEANVSIATVSRVINQRVDVSEETRLRVGELIKKYSFTTEYTTTRLPKIALLIPQVARSGYLHKAMEGVFDYSEERDIEISVMIRNSRHRNTLLHQLRDQQCSGAVVLLGEQFQRQHKEFEQAGMPIVFLDTEIKINGVGCINHDSYTGSLEATRHLIALGHRKIGYLKYWFKPTNHQARFRGYQDAMREAGLEANPEWVQSSSKSGPSFKQETAGLFAMRELLQRVPDLTAVLTVDDQAALGAVTAIHESGRRIPDDFSVIGFDNLPETEAWFPALTTVEHPVAKEGYQAAAAIHSAWADPGNWQPPRILMPTKLIIRNSAGPVKSR